MRYMPAPSSVCLSLRHFSSPRAPTFAATGASNISRFRHRQDAAPPSSAVAASVRASSPARGQSYITMAGPKTRLAQLQSHFKHTSDHDIPLNTPYSIGREHSRGYSAQDQDDKTDNRSDLDWQPPSHADNSSFPTPEQRRYYSTSTSRRASEEYEGLRDKNAARVMSKQAPHPTLLIPGPIEYDDAVLESMSHYSEAHVGQPFVNVFGEALTMLRKVFQSTDPKAQPFVISGSGTLGWDQVCANLTERGEDALVASTGYFGEAWADCFETYGVNADRIRCPIGEQPSLAEIEEALKKKKYKIACATQTDTSTGVLFDIKGFADLVKRVSPDTLIAVDGVCSIGCEDLKFDEWGIDAALTGSQKALGVPAGLSILMASGRAIETLKSRKTPPSSYFASWKNWLPIMQNYEAKKPSYFATPSPQLIHALHTSLKMITSTSLDERFKQHIQASDKVKKAVSDLGLKQLATKPENQAHGMTAVYLPEGLTPPDILPSLLKKGVIFAGGLHKEIATKYIRLGHMGVSVTKPERGDIDRAINSLKEALSEVKK